MAIRKLTNAAYLATNWQDEVESKNDLKKGFCIIELDSVAKQVKAGSVVEANGVLYKSDTATSPSNTPADGQYYLYMRDISGVLDFYLTSEEPIFNYIKNGWYGSTNTTWRAVASLVIFASLWQSINYERNFEIVEIPIGSLYIDSPITFSTSQQMTVSSTKYGMSSSTNSLVITLPGIYEISLSIKGKNNNTSSNASTFYIRKNGSNLNTYGLVNLSGSTTTGDATVTDDMLVNLVTGDSIDTYVIPSIDGTIINKLDLILKKVD